MTHSRGVGGSAQHDLRREGTVSPREHNLRRGGGTTSPREAKLEDPELPHKPKSGREARRAAEREQQRAEAGAGEDAGSEAGGERAASGPEGAAKKGRAARR